MIEFEVPGKPQGKARPRFSRDGRVYTPSATRAYEKRVRDAYRAQTKNARFPSGTPIKATVAAYFQIPASTSKKKRATLNGTPYTKKCDIDNLLKLLFDSVNGAAYDDDAAICEVHAAKFYTAGEPYVLVRLEAVGGGKEEYA